MAKDSPWFKFIPSEWNDGQISLCSYSAKGLFADLIALYWSREGDLDREFAFAKLCKDPEPWQELFDREIYTLDGAGRIVIKFLDEQLAERVETSKKAKESIAKRWEKDNQKGPKQPKNTVVSDPYYDKNTAVKSSNYGADTNKKEKREDKILDPSVGKGSNKDNGVAGKPAKTLPPLRAVGFADEASRLAEMKKYGQVLEDFIDGGENWPEREKLNKAIAFFWPTEFTDDERKTIEQIIAAHDDIGMIGILSELSANLKAGEVEKITVKKYFE